MKHQYNDTFSMKKKTLIGTWNIRMLNAERKLEETVAEIKKCKLQIVGLSECRKNGSGEVKLTDGIKLLFSVRELNDTRRDGVGFVLSKSAYNA